MASPQLAPTSGGGGDYTSLQEGENKLRIVSPIIAGYKWWTVAGKVMRSENNPGRPADCRPPSGDYSNDPAIMWACAVYNYDTKKVELWEFGQKGITDGLTKLDSDPDWGDLLAYGIKVFKNNDKGKISYSVMPGKEAPLTAEIAEAVAAKPINLKALFTNGNPFEAPVGTKVPAAAGAAPDDNDLPF